jgi:hypothetical protein
MRRPCSPSSDAIGLCARDFIRHDCCLFGYCNVAMRLSQSWQIQSKSSSLDLLYDNELYSFGSQRIFFLSSIITVYFLFFTKTNSKSVVASKHLRFMGHIMMTSDRHPEQTRYPIPGCSLENHRMHLFIFFLIFCCCLVPIF